MVNISDLDKYYVTYNDVEFTDFSVDINSNSSYNFSFLDLENSWKEFSAGDKGLQIIHGGESCDVDGNCD